MSDRVTRCAAFVSVSLLLSFSVGAVAQDTSLIAGQNVNMVSGTIWPDGDPFLQRQNEPSIGVSTRNELHLMGGSNDYRTVDLPGLPEGKTTGDSWLSSYFSYDGGGRWTSTLLPGYPQDTSPEGTASPLKTAIAGGYEASADPVIRPGTHGLFYYSGIAFTRGDSPPSAGFVATYIDLNNDERGDTVKYLRTVLFDQNDDGSSFIDKPWIAVDKPRSPATRLIEVPTDSGPINQEVQCGNLYVGYARIQGEGNAALSSQIMFSSSEDCGESFSTPIELSSPGTINQGAYVAVDPGSGRVQVAWRQFENAALLSCTNPARYWRLNPEAWPVDDIELAGITITQVDGQIMIDPGDDADDYGDHYRWGRWLPKRVFRQYLAAWLNVLAGAGSADIEDALADAEEFLLEYPLGSRVRWFDRRKGHKILRKLRRFNRGHIGPGACDDLIVSDPTATNPNAIMISYSDDFGGTFSEPQAISGPNYFPFEQGTTEYSFRSTGYPTMTFDASGRSYVAWTTRGLAIPDFDPVGGDGRIVVTTSNDGDTWTLPVPIDEPEVRGHQLMPAFEYSREQVFLLYYDFRADVSGVFDRFVTDLPVDPTTPRHSVDVRAAVAEVGDLPQFTDYTVLDNESTQTSKYPFLILSDENDEPFSQQTEYNPPNLPMFQGGLVPFFGDFIDLAALHFVRDDMGNWDFDTDPAKGPSVLHAVWTDNRDVVAPLDGDWTSYVPPGGDGSASIFDPSQNTPVCTPGTTGIDRTKMRNQNIYTSRLTQGIAVAVPGNNRPLGTIQRAFVAFVQNLTDTDKQFRLEILDQPLGGSASFDQFAPQPQTDEVVERQSSIAKTIYVSSSDPSASVDISVVEVDAGGVPVPGGLTARTSINADPSAPSPTAGNILDGEIYTPAIFNPAIFNSNIFNTALLGTGEVGIYNPAIFNPAIFNNPEDAEFAQAALQQLALLNPAIFNPAIFNPAIFNPAIFNPAIFNPAIFNPAIFNPAIFNPAIFNVGVANPAIFNPAIFNPAIFNSSLVETSVVVENTGNATAAYSLNLDLETPPAGFLFQVMVYRTYLVPSVEDCVLTEVVAQEQLVSELTPDVTGSLLNPDATTFYVAPDDNVVVTVRVVPDPNNPGDPDTIDELDEINLSQSVTPQAVDTESAAEGETQPEPVVILAPVVPPLVIDTSPLASGTTGVPYLALLGVSGGNGTPVSWSLVPGNSLPPGLSLSPSGQISGTPTVDGVFAFDVRVQDDVQVADESLSLTIAPGGLPPLPLVSESSSFGPGTITFDPGSGQRWLDVTLSTPYSYDQVKAELLPGGLFEEFRLGTSAEIIAFWDNVGIDTSVLGTFVPQNLQPIQDLFPFVGLTGPNVGNLGGGNFFDFTVGHIESGPGGGGVFVTTAGIAADPVPTMTGRASFGGVPSDNNQPRHGSWLTYGGSITNVTLSSSTLQIGGPLVSYSAELANVTGVTLQPFTTVQAWIDQGSASRAAGGTQVSCGAGTGEFPPGNCTVNFTLNANNTTSAGTGTLVPGPATARIDLEVDNVVYYTFRAPITLSQLGSVSWLGTFDFTSETPAGPYVCLRAAVNFTELIPTGEGFLLQVFDNNGGPVIGQWDFASGFGFPISNVGNEVTLTGSQLADGVGEVVLTFDQPNVPGMSLQGRPGPCIGGTTTPFVPVNFTPLP